MFAVGGGGLLGHGKHHRRHKPEIEIPIEEPEVPKYSTPYSYYGYPGFEIGGKNPVNMKPRESPKPNKINITIVLPSISSSTNVQVENKTKDDKKNRGDIENIGSENE